MSESSVPAQDRGDLALSAAEQNELARLEIVIEDGIATFVRVGDALMGIRDRRLYRETHSTFEDYLHERWSISRPRAYQLMQAAAVVEVVSTTVDISPPTTERQARELAPLLEKPEVLKETWTGVVEQNPEPTAAAVHEAVDRAKDRQKPTQKKRLSAVAVRTLNTEKLLNSVRAINRNAGKFQNIKVTGPPYYRARAIEDIEAAIAVLQKAVRGIGAA